MALQPHLSRGFPVPVSMLRGGESVAVGGGNGAGAEEGAAQTLRFFLPRLSVRR